MVDPIDYMIDLVATFVTISMPPHPGANLTC